MTHPAHPLLGRIQALHRRIRDDVVEACEQAAVDGPVGGGARGRGRHDLRHRSRGRTRARRRDRPDDRDTGRARACSSPRGCRAARSWCRLAPIRRRSRWVIIVDPIDGTRGLMYQKRPAWILTGVAAGPGAAHAGRHRTGGADRDSAGQAAPVRRALGGARPGRRRRTLQSAHRAIASRSICIRRRPRPSRTDSR